MATARTITCTPSELLNTYPCLACLSETELKAVIVVALAANNSKTVAETLSESACFKCLSDKQKLQAATAVIANEYLSSYTVPEIRELIKCLLCGPADALDAALTYLLCIQLNAQVE